MTRRSPGYYDEMFGLEVFGAPARRQGSPLASSSPHVVDARLRGVSPLGLSGARPGASRADRSYKVTHGDPYDEVARKEAEIGRRMPLPYQSASALAGTLPMNKQRYQTQYEDLHNEHAVYAAPTVAGRRMTAVGTYGADQAQTIPWTARDRFGYGRLGARGGGGYDETWDARNARERRSGRLTDTTRFSQAVDHRYPFLFIVARGEAVPGVGDLVNGNARIRVTAGLSETGGAEVIREVWLGGGLTARFDMQGWDQVTIQVLDLLDGTNVQFAWVTNGLQSANAQGSLYLPQRVTRGAGAQPVPEGAYAVVVEDPSLAVPGTTVDLVWTTFGAAFPGDVTMSVEVDDGASGTTNQFGQPLPVLGTAITFVGAGTLDVVWFLRSI